MSKIQIWKSSVDAARDRCSMSPSEHAVLDEMIGGITSGNVPLEVERLPAPFIRALMEDSRLKPNQRAVLALFVHGLRTEDLDLDSLYQLKVGTPLEFGSTMAALSQKRATAELRWNNRWYPVMTRCDIREDDQKLAKHVSVRVTLAMGRHTHDVWRFVDPTQFADEDGAAVELTILQVLERLGFRKLQIPAQECNLRLVRAERLSAESGTQVWVKGAVLSLHQMPWMGGGLGTLPMGTTEMPRKAVVEPLLGDSESNHGFGAGQGMYRAAAINETASRIPLVRVFSLDSKCYIFADVDDLETYVYDETALDRLYIQPAMKSILQKVFETPTDQLFGDLVRGKHGGVVILACGNPGVGKTLTAEVYAEMSQRPLYVLEFGELGTRVEEIEQSLQRVFARVVAWRAVLQFDECEIFLGHRGEDLNRSAIVGIFLRMLDYYEGLLFLTSNRADALDEAIRSRVMLKLEYPDLDHGARTQVWRTMFTAAGLVLTDDNFEAIGTPEINGRQIRNLVRLARILHPGRELNSAQVMDLLQYGCK